MSLASIEDYIQDVHQHAQDDTGDVCPDGYSDDPWYMPKENLWWLDGAYKKTFLVAIGEECTSIEQVMGSNRGEFPDLYKDV